MGDNIKMDLSQMECENLDWIHLDENGTNGGVLWTRQWEFRFP